MIGECKWCGRRFVKEKNAQAYCCEEHRKEARRQQNRDNFNRWRLSHINDIRYEEKSLGSGSLGPHRHEDFNKENLKIGREFSRLGIQKRRLSSVDVEF